ncbi:hypothetical protein LEMLEM_LOCUS16364 [Lemmus lemmus]
MPSFGLADRYSRTSELLQKTSTCVVSAGQQGPEPGAHLRVLTVASPRAGSLGFSGSLPGAADRPSTYCSFEASQSYRSRCTQRRAVPGLGAKAAAPGNNVWDLECGAPVAFWSPRNKILPTGLVTDGRAPSLKHSGVTMNEPGGPRSSIAVSSSKSLPLSGRAVRLAGRPCGRGRACSRTGGPGSRRRAPQLLCIDASSRWRSSLGAGRGALPARRGPEHGAEGSAAQVPAASRRRLSALLDGAARAEPSRSLPRRAGSPVQLEARDQRARLPPRSPRLGGASLPGAGRRAPVPRESDETRAAGLPPARTRGSRWRER